MTPEEEFAAKRLEAEQLIRQHAPARLQDQLISLLRPAIALTATRTDDAHIPVDASKFGGAPDVPSDFEWPMWNQQPLLFLLQINLEEVAAFDVEDELPSTGLLSFFYGVEEGPWENLHEVFWFKCKPLQRVESPPSTSKTSICTFSPAVNVDTGDYFEELNWEDFQLLEEGERIKPDYQEGKIVPKPALLKLLGRAIEGETGMSDWDQHGNLIEPEPQKGGYRPLLQVHCDNTLGIDDWGDMYFFCFFIHEKHLAARRFDKTHAATAWG